MPKNLWERERSAVFRNTLNLFLAEGYNKKEAKRLARREVEEIMLDKDDFVNDIWDNQFDDC